MLCFRKEFIIILWVISISLFPVVNSYLILSNSKYLSSQKYRFQNVLNIGMTSTVHADKFTHVTGKYAKILVSSIAFMFISLSDSWGPSYFVVGGIGNSILSKILKKIIKQPRPDRSTSDGYGMPSSHAQSIFYFITIAALLIQQHQSKLFSIPMTAILFTYAFFANKWRVQTGLHTITQTLVGAGIGSIVGFLIYNNWNQFQKYSITCTQSGSELCSLFSKPVPVIPRVLAIMIGAIVLYRKEIQEKLQ